MAKPKGRQAKGSITKGKFAKHIRVTEKGQRFLEQSSGSARRRAFRMYRRSARQDGAKEQNRNRPTTSRAAPQPCGCTRRNRCIHRQEMAEVESHVDAKAESELQAAVAKGDLLNVSDTFDTSFFLDMHREDVREGRLSISDYFGLASMFRMHNSTKTWQAMVDNGCFPLGRAPLWADVEKTLEGLWRTGKVYGGFYYSRTLSKYSTDGGKTWLRLKAAKTPEARAQRDTLALRLLWEATPRTEWEAYATSEGPTAEKRALYAAAYDSLLANINASAKGLIQDYGFKVVLDIMVMSGHVCQGHLSKWPIDGCPGYVKGLAELCPGLPKHARLWALYYVHRLLGSRHGLKFPESVMHLCWLERRKKGLLQDS